jgi:hypothetical protein
MKIVVRKYRVITEGIQHNNLNCPSRDVDYCKLKARRGKCGMKRNCPKKRNKLRSAIDNFKLTGTLR